MSLNKDLYKGLSKLGGYGIFASATIEKGAWVMTDPGRILSRTQYMQLSPDQKNKAYQIGEDEVLVPEDYGKISDEWYVNHSCDPNTMYSNGAWYTTKILYPGDEITHDYAVLWTNDLEPFEINPCLCGSPLCRGIMTGNDWKIPALQERYKGHFMPFLNRII